MPRGGGIAALGATIESIILADDDATAIAESGPGAWRAAASYAQCKVWHLCVRPHLLWSTQQYRTSNVVCVRWELVCLPRYCHPERLLVIM